MSLTNTVFYPVHYKWHHCWCHIVWNLAMTYLLYYNAASHVHFTRLRTTQRITYRQARASCTLCPPACSASTERVCPTPGTTPSPTTRPRARCPTWWRRCRPRPSVLSTTPWRRCWSTASKLVSPKVRVPGNHWNDSGGASDSTRLLN